MTDENFLKNLVDNNGVEFECDTDEIMDTFTHAPELDEDEAILYHEAIFSWKSADDKLFIKVECSVYEYGAYDEDFGQYEGDGDFKLNLDSFDIFLSKDGGSYKEVSGDKIEITEFSGYAKNIIAPLTQALTDYFNKNAKSSL